MTNRALDAELLVLRAVDEVRGDFRAKSSASTQDIEMRSHTLLQAGDLARRERDPDFVQFCRGHSACCVVFLFSLSDVTHLEFQIVSGDCKYDDVSIIVRRIWTLRT